MKKITFMLFIVFHGSYADLSVNQIEKMVLKIHEKRDGIRLQTLESTKEPFVHTDVDNNESTYVEPEKEEIKLSLHAILNNKAYINNKWYGLDEKIGEYVLKYVGKSSVVLKNENRIKKLFLYKKKRIIFQ